MRTLPMSLLLIFSCLILITCREDDGFGPDPKLICRDIAGDPLMDYLQISMYPELVSPSFNPLNADEFAYLRYENSDENLPLATQREIHIHKLSTGEDRTIYRGALVFHRLGR